MKITSKVTSDLKPLSNLLRRLKLVDEWEAEYGYYEDDAHSSGLNMAELARMQNDGTAFIPDRPFMDETDKAVGRFFQVNKKWANELNAYLRNGGSIKGIYQHYANLGADYVRTTIDIGDWADNAEWWRQAKIEKYGTTAPLIETQELYNSAKGKARKAK